MRIPDPDEVVLLACQIRGAREEVKKLESQWAALFTQADTAPAAETPPLQTRIIQFLDSRPNDVFSVSHVAGELSANENSVGPYLSKLVGEGKIARRGRGLYGTINSGIQVIGESDTYAFTPQ